MNVWNPKNNRSGAKAAVEAAEKRTGCTRTERLKTVGCAPLRLGKFTKQCYDERGMNGGGRAFAKAGK